MAPRYANLVLSGGGQRCLAFVGFLSAAGPAVRSVRNVYCVSGGAIAGLAFALGLADDAVARLVCRHMTEGVRASLALLLSRFGLDDARDRLSGLLGDMIAEAGGPLLAPGRGPGDVTFADLAGATGMNLVVHAVSAVTGEVRALSAGTTPGASVVDSVCASCAVPLLFCPVEVAGDLLMDGCLAESYPLSQLAAPGAGPSAPDPAGPDTLVLSAEFDAPGAGGAWEAAPPATLVEFGLRVAGILAARGGWGRREAAEALGPRARVFRVNAACAVTAAKVICDGLDAASVAELYRVGLGEGRRFLREEEEAGAPPGRKSISA